VIRNELNSTVLQTHFPFLEYDDDAKNFFNTQFAGRDFGAGAGSGEIRAEVSGGIDQSF
jgi:hypothetical protein